ncbi:MAG: hypothetical protein DBX59_10555 [Bacillota bacterium]|nr:MAG: hypothetical protein DBX59_10555 [Bacillota bacterium]
MKKTLRRSWICALLAVIALSAAVLCIGLQSVPTEAAASESVFAMETGASVKLKTDGLRFKVKMSADIYAGVVTNDAEDTVKLSFYIAPYSYFETAEFDAAKLQDKVVAEADEDKIYREGEYYYANACITNLGSYSQQQYSFVGVAVISENGAATKYAALDADVAANHARTLYEVVNAAVLYSEADYSTAIFAETSPYKWYGTAEYPVAINDIADYDNLIRKVNGGETFAGKVVAKDKGVDVSQATETLGEGKTLPEIGVLPEQGPVLTLLNDFESESDILIDPEGNSVIWTADNAQKAEDYTLNTDPQFVYNGKSSLKIAMSARSANYWPGVKFFRSNSAETNDFSEYYSASMMIYNESEQKIWLYVGTNPGKSVGLEPNVWTKVEILVSEMAANGIAADNLLNAAGNFYFWFTFESGFKPVNLYVDALYVQPDDGEIVYDTPKDFVTVNSFEIAPDAIKTQGETYAITAPVYELSAGTGEISYRVYAPDGTEIKKTDDQPFAAGDEIALAETGVYKVEYTLTFDNGRTRVKSTDITVKAAVVEPKDDVLYADFDDGLVPDLADMGAVWANYKATMTHNTKAEFAKDGGSVKFGYTVGAVTEWPSFRFSGGKFPALSSDFMTGLKKITMEIYNAGSSNVVIKFKDVAVTLQSGWNSVAIEEARLADAGIDGNFHFFITSSEYTVGEKIELYVDNVWLRFN